MTIRRGGSPRRARCARIASGGVRRMRPGRGTAGTDALVDFTAGMMVLRVSPQAPRVTVRLAASFGLALIRLLVPMRQHMSVPATEIQIRSLNPGRARDSRLRDARVRAKSTIQRAYPPSRQLTASTRKFAHQIRHPPGRRRRGEESTSLALTSAAAAATRNINRRP